MAIQLCEVSKQLALSAGRRQSKSLFPTELMIDAMCDPQQKNENFRQSHNFILPKLFSGELDISELEVEIKEFAA